MYIIGMLMHICMAQLEACLGAALNEAAVTGDKAQQEH